MSSVLKRGLLIIDWNANGVAEKVQELQESRNRSTQTRCNTSQRDQLDPGEAVSTSQLCVLSSDPNLGLRRYTTRHTNVCQKGGRVRPLSRRLSEVAPLETVHQVNEAVNSAVVASSRIILCFTPYYQ